MAAPLLAETIPSQSRGHLDVTLTYDGTLSKAANSNTFWMEGGSVQLHGHFYRGFGVVADIAGSHASHIGLEGVGLDRVTTTFDPRFTWAPGAAPDRNLRPGSGRGGQWFS